MLKDITSEFLEDKNEKIFSRKDDLIMKIAGKEMIIPQSVNAFWQSQFKYYRTDNIQDIIQNYNFLCEEKPKLPKPDKEEFYGIFDIIIQRQLEKIEKKIDSLCETTKKHINQMKIQNKIEKLSNIEGQEKSYITQEIEIEEEIEEEYLNGATRKYFEKLFNTKKIFKPKNVEISEEMFETRKEKIRANREIIVRKEIDKIESIYGRFKDFPYKKINLENIAMNEIREFEVPGFVEGKFFKYKVYELRDFFGGTIEGIYEFETPFEECDEEKEMTEKLSQANPLRRLDLWVMAIKNSPEPILLIKQIYDDKKKTKQKNLAPICSDSIPKKTTPCLV